MYDNQVKQITIPEDVMKLIDEHIERDYMPTPAGPKITQDEQPMTTPDLIIDSSFIKRLRPRKDGKVVTPEETPEGLTNK